MYPNLTHSGWLSKFNMAPNWQILSQKNKTDTKAKPTNDITCY